MAALVTILCFAVYLVGYRYYSKHLASKVFSLDPAAVTPAHAMTDGVDYVPTNKFVLFGHHWASITSSAACTTSPHSSSACAPGACRSAR
jgi:carbon starvation protein